MPPTAIKTAAPPPRPIAARLLRWYDRHGRKDLPWQRARDPYRIWVAEVMLQQTQVRAVIPYYQRFIARFPTLASLAQCDVDELLRYWSGLGYYARARNLRAAARQIVARHGGKFPARLDDAQALPGIGRTTAAAIMVFAFGQRQAILDGNVKRVLARYCAVNGYPGEAKTQARLWRIAERLLPRKRIADYTQALMDLGATVCMRGQPLCASCPLAADCRAYLAGNPVVYPAPKPAPKTRPRKAVFMLVARNRRGELLLLKRPPAGIWGGLWSPPEFPRRTKTITPKQRRRIEQQCARQFGIAATTGETLPAFAHSFTHFDLDILPLLAECDGAAKQNIDAQKFLWYNPNSPAQVGVPAALNRILESLNEPQSSVR